jgi:hypothetical protein
MERTGLSEFAEIRDYETLTNKIIGLASIQYPSKLHPEGLAERVQSWRERFGKKPDNLKSVLEYSAFLFNAEQDETLIPNCGKALKMNKDSKIAHTILGQAFARNDLFHPAYLFFNHGLSLKGDNSDDCPHREFHKQLAKLIFQIHEKKPGVSIEEFGFSTKGFKFNGVFYLPDFDYNFPVVDYKTFGMQIGKERTLASIHLYLDGFPKINGNPHTAENCPIL